MGSIKGSAKAPAQQVVYVPATVTTDTNTATTTEPTEEEKLEARAENVLRRSRSRLGTILTSFKGILSQNDLAAPRKTLLGE